MRLQYTSKAEQWEAVQAVAEKHGLVIYKLTEVLGISEWILVTTPDMADISNFANELGEAGILATCSMAGAIDSDQAILLELSVYLIH